ncbi:MAG: EAL domain-containing protein [Pseudomonadota bacterium]|nr:EAL domain-containing protein [Pseudomonadota bacterium]
MQQIILLLQENAVKAAIVQELLTQSTGKRFVIEWTRSCSAALERLRDRSKANIAAILIDLRLPDGQPLPIFDRIFQASVHTPILVLSGPEHEGIAERAVQHGAQDYILDNQLDGSSLVKAVRNMLERTAIAEASFVEKERAQVTLNSIGDAVISTDVAGNVTYLNQVAEAMTGWSSAEALGRSFSDVFQIIDGTNAEPTSNPIAAAMQENKTVGLAAGSVLIRRDGHQAAIEDSTAPIHDRRGQVTGAVIVFHDVSHAHAMSERMSYLAHHDYLTELPNRLLFNDRLAQAMAAARRHDEQLAVLFVDVDRFKHVNDSLGHAIGDQLLLSVADRLAACVRASDTVSRQGGDEFVILLSTIAHAEDAAVSATKILTALSMPHGVKEHELQITLSIGIAVYPDDGNDAESLVKHADIAMLNAKNNGRNNYQFFRSDMNEHALERQSLESGLRHALDGREFVLHYQPKMDLATEAITGAEALVRWRQPGRGMVLPDKFIPIAEQCGYIVPIGRWVLREACRQAKLWLDTALVPTPVAINVSAVELRSRDFIPGVRAILKETGLNPRYLEFELTETALMQDPTSTITVLQALKDMGVRLTLDDFGTGYSSLSYLKRFPIDALKIDKSFVRGLCTNAGDANIVSAVINMGKSFGLKVIAEGVETRAQFLRLQAQQCTEGQGYYFNEPVAASEFAKLLGPDLSITVVA